MRVKNVFSTKLLVEGKEKKSIILYNDVYVPRKKRPASAKDSGDGTPSLCVHVSKDLSLA